MIPSRQIVLEAGDRVAPFVHRTPVLTSRLLNELSGAEVFFKCENLQKMGAFKMRGAINAVQQLSETQKKAGVVTHSSGNFGQALALAAKKLGVKAYIVMPSSAPAVKTMAVKAYGGLVTISEPTLEAREKSAAAIVEEEGAVFLHPSNDLNVIVGQGTAALELLQDHPDLEFIMTPVGGGGLIAGTALAAHYLGTNCVVVGAEPREVDDAYRALKSGEIEYNITTDTVADGLKTNLGDINFPIIKELVSDIIRVEEDGIVAAMKLIWERMKLVIEPSSAVPFAGLLKEREKYRNKKIGIILSGGNVELSNLPF
ncbi:pyridoxal-phosphate dependent enzyme [Arenibacter sp. ARW7G5Y1]|uniref:pyridoxal-phosphate dependent enzyme n=1 Tax=Arenibacter sp. ARW7G5Y1 TaxID=2135619 RepID=UPI000D77498C|nr:pyridoxal-phosphate dependent enzyme [Arenibacter sp. ARW7G5Y1]PXX25256.1 threonine dehydratase [Arenibacter sp. ARW7G5Y1]